MLDPFEATCGSSTNARSHISRAHAWNRVKRLHRPIVRLLHPTHGVSRYMRKSNAYKAQPLKAVRMNVYRLALSGTLTEFRTLAGLGGCAAGGGIPVSLFLALPLQLNQSFLSTSYIRTRNSGASGQPSKSIDGTPAVTCSGTELGVGVKGGSFRQSARQSRSGSLHSLAYDITALRGCPCINFFSARTYITWSYPSHSKTALQSVHRRRFTTTVVNTGHI
jgi:hypothetical protein